MDARGSEDFQRVPFRDWLYQRDRSTWISHFEATSHRPLRNGFWHAWHKFHSDVEVVYASAAQRHSWDRRFDVILAAGDVLRVIVGVVVLFSVGLVMFGMR